MLALRKLHHLYFQNVSLSHFYSFYFVFLVSRSKRTKSIRSHLAMKINMEKFRYKFDQPHNQINTEGSL